MGGFPPYGTSLPVLCIKSLILSQNKPKTDTSALEARNGKDIQGIPWERLNFTRDKYRETRLEQYKNYENLSRPREELEKVSLDLLQYSLDIFFSCRFFEVGFSAKGLQSSLF